MLQFPFTISTILSRVYRTPRTGSLNVKAVVLLIPHSRDTLITIFSRSVQVSNFSSVYHLSNKLMEREL